MKFFTDHPASVGESYLDHMHVALSFGFSMVGGGLACIVHGVLPALFVRTGSETVGQLHSRMVTSRRTKRQPPGAHFDYVI